MDHIAIIKELGGAKSLAEALTVRGVPVAPVTVRSWSLSGRMIPSKYWVHVAAVARERNISVSFEALADAAATRPTGTTEVERAA